MNAVVLVAVGLVAVAGIFILWLIRGWCYIDQPTVAATSLAAVSDLYAGHEKVTVELAKAGWEFSRLIVIPASTIVQLTGKVVKVDNQTNAAEAWVLNGQYAGRVIWLNMLKKRR